ncbi:hypothetical protein D3877_05850 [Azospirillum cavernae]|uniref:Uncharacterized protein n=1 Tax=Azospirillum cavernae TaxID=2320860 RepID=A0A418W2A8_9PROT|nr:DUF6524 family protein [Azospirillum cavernae]RJF84126.1 hypothetical protein D3877_05850 [Azospirillum cavernae]
MKFPGLFSRILSCFFLVFATWNPLGYSYLDWLFTSDGSYASAKFFVGAILVGAYIVYLRVTWLALQVFRSAIMATLAISGYFALRHVGLLDANAPFWSSYFLLFLVSTLLSIGICWAHVKRRLTGQSQVLSPPP